MEEGGEGCSGIAVVVRDESGRAADGVKGTAEVGVTLDGDSVEESDTGGVSSPGAMNEEPRALRGRALEDALLPGALPLGRRPIPREEDVLPVLSRRGSFPGELGTGEAVPGAGE